MPLDSAGFNEVPDYERIARAYDCLVTNGWCQRKEVDAGSMCGGFALVIAWELNGIYSLHQEPIERLVLEIANETTSDNRRWFAGWRKLQTQYSSIPEWNDAEGRTLEEVLACFERIYYQLGGPQGGLDNLKKRYAELNGVPKTDPSQSIRVSGKRRELIAACIGLFAICATYFTKI